MENISNDYESASESCESWQTECERDGTKDSSNSNIDFDGSLYEIAAEPVTQVPNLAKVNHDPWIDSY